MKDYDVYVDITVSVMINVSAESEDKARELANSKVIANPYYLVHKDVMYVDHEITDVYENE